MLLRLSMLNPCRLSALLRTRYCGHHVLQFCQLDSTNRLLAEWAKRKLDSDLRLPEGTVAIATRQSSGRGQRGHKWISAPGGLYASVLLYPDIEAKRLLELTLAVAWGVAIQLREFRGLDVRLKWPNDLMVAGRKLGGILLQAQLQRGRVRSLVAGIGLNGHNLTPEIGISLTDVSTGNIDLTAVAADVFAGIERGYECWKPNGLSGLVPSYQSLMMYCDRSVNLTSTNARAKGTGTIMGIDSDGQLQVVVDGQLETFKPGHIHLGYEHKMPTPSAKPTD
ncbi:MAG: biotin--[acetyl-CoA-carboxylase] ligase [Cyanobacteria bacterium P01_E01_bin.34]